MNWPYHGMTFERYQELQRGPDPQQLTNEEIETGWLWSVEFDGLLIHKTWPEYEFEAP